MRRSRLSVKPNIGGSKGGPPVRSITRPSLAPAKDKQEPTQGKIAEVDNSNAIKSTIPITAGIPSQLKSKTFAVGNHEITQGNEFTKSTEVDSGSFNVDIQGKVRTHSTSEVDGQDATHIGDISTATEEIVQQKISTSKKDDTKTKLVPSVETASINPDRKDKESEVLISKEKNDNHSTAETAETNKLEFGEGGGKISAPRPRSRFTKARPNLGEGARPRMRHLSGGDVTMEMKKPSPVQRDTRSEVPEGICSNKAEKSGPMKEEDKVRKEVAKESVADREKAKPPGKDITAEGDNMPILGKAEEIKRKRRKLEWLSSPVDKSKVTMRDLIYMNPISNPMQSTLDAKERRRKQREVKKGALKSSASVCSASVCSETPMPSPESILISDDDEVELLDEAEKDKEKEQKGKKVEPKEEEEDGEALPVPQVRIGPDGQIVLNEQSLLITQKENGNVSDTEVIHEQDSLSGTNWYGRKTQTKQWTDKETKKFYLALSAVGTDFSLMTNLFVKRSRAELKRKFKREEKHHKDLVDSCIRERQQFDMEFFRTLANLDIDADPPVKRQRKQRAKRNQVDDKDDAESVVSTVDAKKKKVPTATLR